MQTTKRGAAGIATLFLLVAGGALADSPPLDGYPTIYSADADGGSLFIGGVHFGTALQPVVKLGGTTLTVTSYSPTAIVATLPSGTGPASYPLWVKSFATPSSLSDRSAPVLSTRFE